MLCVHGVQFVVGCGRQKTHSAVKTGFRCASPERIEEATVWGNRAHRREFEIVSSLARQLLERCERNIGPLLGHESTHEEKSEGVITGLPGPWSKASRVDTTVDDARVCGGDPIGFVIRPSEMAAEDRVRQRADLGPSLRHKAGSAQRRRQAALGIHAPPRTRLLAPKPAPLESPRLELFQPQVVEVEDHRHPGALDFQEDTWEGPVEVPDRNEVGSQPPDRPTNARPVESIVCCDRRWRGGVHRPMQSAMDETATGVRSGKHSETGHQHLY